MLHWHTLLALDITPGQNTKISSSDLAHQDIAKKLLGLGATTELRNFNFEIEIFGALSECRFGSSCQFDDGLVQKILATCQAQRISVAFEDGAQIPDLLNLFDREDDGRPTLAMLLTFLRSNKKSFQKLGENLDDFWIGEWSDVNSWTLFWRSSDTFNCLGKTSG